MPRRPTLDCHHPREHVHLQLIDDAERGLADIAAGRTLEAGAAIDQPQRRRNTAATQSL